jgi:hypothetical protein
MSKEIVKKIMQSLMRKKTPVIFKDLCRISPISKYFGIERGNPIDRYYIDKFLQKNSELISGVVLEMGDSHYSRRLGNGRVKKYEILHVTPHNKSATIIGDLTNISSLPANRVDCFICTQTFNFIFEVTKAVEGAHHLLKPGGWLLATVSGISQISRYDMNRWGDYWRFTTASAEKLFGPVFRGNVGIESFGNVLAATAFLQGVAVEDLPNPALLDENDPDYQVVITVLAQKSF